MSEQSLYGLTRVQQEKSRTRCWVVSLQRRGKVWRKTFSDLKFGGKAASMKAALAYRDKVVAKHPPMNRVQYMSILRKNNISGVAGVCRVTKGYHKDGIARAYWIARMPGKAPSCLRAFSVVALGENEARRRAINARKQALSSIAGKYINSRQFKEYLESAPRQAKVQSRRELRFANSDVIVGRDGASVS